MKKYTLPVVLLALFMVLTRFHHFGSAISLPDASLAVFFLAGWFCPLWLIFAGLILEAGLIDYVAIHFQGTSSFCVTSAYVALIPTYAIMWQSGRIAKRQLASSGDILTITAWATFASMGAFLLSNGSFYVFSGYFSHLNWVDYSASVAHYFSPYVTAALMYIAAGLGLYLLAVRFGWLQTSQHAHD